MICSFDCTRYNQKIYLQKFIISIQIRAEQDKGVRREHTKLCDRRAIWNLTRLCEVSKNIFAFKTSNSRQTSERRGSVYNTWLRNDTISNEEGRSLKWEKNNMVITEKRIHLFPYRTQKLSSSSLMVLRPKGLGRVGHSQLLIRSSSKVEHPAVNR